MPKITFMGAGSSVFAKNVLGDSMMTPALQDSVIALYDIDPVRLDDSYRMLTAIKNNVGSDANTLLRKKLQCQSSGEAEGGSQPPGKLPAAAKVAVVAIFDPRGKVRVGGTGGVFQRVIICNRSPAKFCHTGDFLIVTGKPDNLMTRLM